VLPRRPLRGRLALGVNCTAVGAWPGKRLRQVTEHAGPRLVPCHFRERMVVGCGCRHRPRPGFPAGALFPAGFAREGGHKQIFGAAAGGAPAPSRFPCGLRPRRQAQANIRGRRRGAPAPSRFPRGLRPRRQAQANIRGRRRGGHRPRPGFPAGFAREGKHKQIFGAAGTAPNICRNGIKIVPTYQAR